MSIYQMQCFLTLAKMLNFTRASEALHVTQPTLSKMLTSIEEEIGVPLIHRTKRNVTLTDAGQNVCRYFEQIINLYQKAIDSTVSISDGKVGTVKIGFTGFMVGNILPKLIHESKNKYPNIDIKLYDALQENLVHLLNLGDLDIAFIDSYALSKGMHVDSCPVFSDKVCVFFHEEHPFSKLDVVPIEALKEERLLVAGRLLNNSSSPTSSNALVSDIMTRYGLIGNLHHKASNINNMMLMVACSYGISILPRTFIDSLPEHVASRPVIINAQDPTSTLDIQLVAAWRATEHANPSVPYIIQLMKDLLQR